MNPSDMNIQNLSRTVLRNVQIDAEKIRAEAEEKANEIKQHARQDRDMEYQKIIDAARKKSSYIKNKNIASAEAEARMTWLIRRENLINQVFDKSLELLPQVAERSDYHEIVENLIQEAVFQLNESAARIHLDKKADQLIDDAQIKKLSDESGVKIERGKILSDQNGIIATTLDGHRQFDNTLQARLHRQKSTMRMAIYKILMGEG
ncbi:MAG: hypothetical protein J7K85_06780 [Anaerolineaceae bacterium]|nr:hypothetical protein [Anaerolineaceae bacterium]